MKTNNRRVKYKGSKTSEKVRIHERDDKYKFEKSPSLLRPEYDLFCKKTLVTFSKIQEKKRRIITRKRLEIVSNQCLNTRTISQSE